MLTRLSVLNLAIVEKAEIAFGDGLNIITGETGAGKSVLMGALELALGARADASAVRDGAKEARVEAEFDLSSPAVAAVLRQVAEEASMLLASGGGLFLELDAESGQAQPMASLLRELGFDPVRAHRDLSGAERFLSATLSDGL